MSHSDFRSTPVGAIALGDETSSMDAAMSPTSLNASASADLLHSNDRIVERVDTATQQQSPAIQSVQTHNEQHSIPARGNHEDGSADAVMVDDAQIEQASYALKAMAHPLRLKILCILAGSAEVSVQGLVERVGTTQSNISQHLSVLREKHVLDCRKDANKVFYRIRDERFLNVIRSVHDALH